MTDQKVSESATVAQSVANETAGIAEPQEWREIRRRELEYIDTRLLRVLGVQGVPPADAISLHSARRNCALHPGWMPPRPRRRMPASHLVARYWVGRSLFDVDVDNPACFRCLSKRSDWRKLERAHLIDRSANGLDHAGNLAMLCRSCHLRMPAFENGEERQALTWASAKPSAVARAYFRRLGQR